MDEDTGNEYFSLPHYSTEFKTASYPQEGLLPYQVSPYPDRLNYRDVTVYADLSYGWGGDEPITFEVDRLPEGLSMDTSGIVTGSPSNIGTTTGITVTATNARGSRVALASFRWVIDRLSGETPPPTEVDGMTRAELFEATRQYAERQDQDVEAMLPTMLLRAEALISRELQTRQMEDKMLSVTVSGTSEYPLPDDYNGFRHMVINYEGGASETPEMVTPDQLDLRGPDMKRQFAIQNDRLRFEPPTPDDGLIELTYYRGLPALTTDASTNWLTARWPDVYHDAMMREVSVFAKDMPAAETWHAEMVRALDSITARDEKERWTNKRLRVKLGSTGGNDAT